ncbi:MAG: sugar phosphate isomerase/epimerase [Saprospiraceae bacterium]|nr:sugar phosphate isomerase/epimerase [Saprospiraceae bacterium]
MISRRKFLVDSAMAGGFVFASPLGFTKPTLPSFHIFSKHLQFLDYADMADAAAELGFNGIELTVRPGGHVEPEHVNVKLSLAVEAIRKVGLSADMMVTAIRNVEDPDSKQVLTIASKLGIKHYRMGYLSLSDDQLIPKALGEYNLQMIELAAFNAAHSITGSYQNHAGTQVGAQIWDLHHLLKNIDPKHLGCQYDIRHAMVEGGTSWTRGLQLIKTRINSIVLKDYLWEKIGEKWKVKNVPLGTGMVDFDHYFKLLKKYAIDVPFVVHYEYDLQGAEHGDRNIPHNMHQSIFRAMKSDLQFVKDLWSNG